MLTFGGVFMVECYEKINEMEFRNMSYKDAVDIKTLNEYNDKTYAELYDIAVQNGYSRSLSSFKKIKIGTYTGKPAAAMYVKALVNGDNTITTRVDAPIPKKEASDAVKDKLKRLEQALEDGILTQEQYEQNKHTLISKVPFELINVPSGSPLENAVVEFCGSNYQPIAVGLKSSRSKKANGKTTMCVFQVKGTKLYMIASPRIDMNTGCISFDSNKTMSPEDVIDKIRDYIPNALLVALKDAMK